MQIALIYGLIAALITWFVMFLDTKLLDNPKTKGTYLKNMFFVAILVISGIYMIGEEKFGYPDMGFSGGYQRGGRQRDYMNTLGEEIMTGDPNF